MFFSIVPFIWWLLTSRKKENFFKWVGLKKPVIKDSIIKIIFIMFIVGIVYMLIMSIIMEELIGNVDGIATTQFEGRGFTALPSILIFAIIRTALSEEIFFRGFLAKRLIKSFEFDVGNIIQAVLFGLIHGMWCKIN